MNPLFHYVQWGRAEGRHINSLYYLARVIRESGIFDESYYLNRYIDVAQSGLDPIGHYMSSGWKEGRDPSSQFSTRSYLSANPNIEINPLLHYLAQGPGKNLDQHVVATQVQLVAESGVFDPAFYLEAYQDVADAGIEPALHFVLSGWSEGRDPSAQFSTKLYLENVEAAGKLMNPVVHWMLIGRHRGLEPAAPRFSRQRWRLDDPHVWATSFENRLHERMEALKTADVSPPLPHEGPTFSILTTVYDTPPKYLRALADTVLAQAFGDFEWLLLDNGSIDPDTIRSCLDVASLDDRFHYFRVEDNLHIIGGNRYVFDRANGRYVVPIDSDDLLYPDSLALFADVLRKDRKSPPAILYSDEHKVDENGIPISLIWRWEFSFSHALVTAPAAHIMAFDRQLADKAQVYTGEYSRGSHDWDSTLRLSGIGARAAHVPEVLYGWRAHAASTASASSAKSYIQVSQTAVMDEALKRLGLDDRIHVEALFPGVVGWYRLVRKQDAPTPALQIDLVLDDSEHGLKNLAVNVQLTARPSAQRRILYPSSRAAEVEPIARDHRIAAAPYDNETDLVTMLNEIDEDAFAKFIVSPTGRLATDTAIWDGLAILESDPVAGVVGGPIAGLDGAIYSVGLVGGLEGFLASPFHNLSRSNIPGHLWYVTRPATALPNHFLAVRAEAMRRGVRVSGLDSDDAVHGVRLCATAARLGYQTVYASGMETIASVPLPRKLLASGDLRSQISDLAPAGQFDWKISPHLTTSAETFGNVRPPSTLFPPGVNAAPLAPAVPLALSLAPELASQPRLNVLIPAIRMSSMSGGPNTALNLAYRLAERGFPVRLMSTDTPLDADVDALWTHAMGISGINRRLPNVEFVDASDRHEFTAIGANDVFLATAWWTAQMVKWARPLVPRPFVYLIQDYEPILYANSTHHALALETYDLDYIPVVNSALLQDFMVSKKIGRFRDDSFSEKALHFEPSVSRDAFHADGGVNHEVGRKRTLLFYARPTSGFRNLFEIGVAALQALVAEGELSGKYWDIIGMGEQFKPVKLDEHTSLQCAPWLSFDAYAEMMRNSDILLSLMLSPHPSYPPIEMAACGGLSVTNSYENKTADRMSAISPNIVTVDPTLEGLIEGLRKAIRQLPDTKSRCSAANISLPKSWDDSFAPLMETLPARLEAIGLRPNPRLAVEPFAIDLPTKTDTAVYYHYLTAAATARQALYLARNEPGLLSFVTTVWNTPVAFFDVLAESVHAQAGEIDFEWFILDNGSTVPWVVERLRQLAAERPYIRLERVEENLGIIGGMRYVAERASGRYILPLDSDDYLDPDCVRAIAWTLQKVGYPPLLYTDEDKVEGVVRSGAYLKPDWDPVLFINSCYIAHLCAIDRTLALELGAYTDKNCEGSHDWDTFTRFLLAGHTPVHLPEVLYSWRMHVQSTALNIDSKPVVYQSQRAVIERFRAGHPKGQLFELKKSPLFGETPDWWLRRRRDEPVQPVTTIRIRMPVDGARSPDPRLPVGVDHQIIELDGSAAVDILLEQARMAAKAGRLIHLMSAGVAPDDDEWLHEAVGQMELFPDTVMVGGRLYSNKTVLCAGYAFGFGQVCDCPDRGRVLADPGYSAQMWKQHSVGAVSAQHAVIDPNFLIEALEALASWRPSFTLLGSWLGAYANLRARRIVYSPFLSGEITIDWDVMVDAPERGRLLSYAAKLVQDSPFWHRDLGRSPENAYVPTHTAASLAYDQTPLPTYAEWRSIARPDQGGSGAPENPGVSFSLLTTLYLKSDPGLFERTAASIRSQTHSNFEWVVLAQGPIAAALETFLATLAEADQRVRLVRLDQNLGIIGGLKHALGLAKNDYVLPVDGDDLVASECLHAMATVISAQPGPPAIIYTDEDIVIGEDFSAPYLRPDWDPVLDLENSWIWHACAFRRDLAIIAGPYESAGSEYCQDWDTVHRFVAQGHAPLHIRMIGYHWRHHPASSSAGDAGNSASSRSVKALLEQKIEQRGLSEYYEPAPYPIFRGAEEWMIRPTARKNDTIKPQILGRGSTWKSDLIEKLTDAPWTMLLNPKIKLKDSTLAHEEMAKYFDFIPDVDVVAGRVVRAGVAYAGWMSDEGGNLYAPYDLPIVDPGHYVLAWKPQSITVGVVDLCAVRTAVLRQALETAPADCASEELGFWLGSLSLAQGRRVAYSPLIEAETTDLPMHVADPRAANLIWRHFGQRAAVGAPALRGAAAYMLRRFV